MTGALLIVTVLVLVPTLSMASMRRVGRLFFFVAGLLFAFGIGVVTQLGGPDSPGLMVSGIGFALAIDAVLAEGIALLWTLIKRRRAVHG